MHALNYLRTPCYLQVLGDMIPELTEAINNQGLVQKVVVLLRDVIPSTKEKLAIQSQGLQMLSK